MPEYIEREKLHKHFENNVTKNEVTVNGQKNLAYLCDHVLHEIRNAPTADVVEVRHGKWLSNGLTQDYVCSECSGIAPVDCEKEDFYESNYCPNCGAKMDGKGD